MRYFDIKRMSKRAIRHIVFHIQNESTLAKRGENMKFSCPILRFFSKLFMKRFKVKNLKVGRE